MKSNFRFIFSVVIILLFVLQKQAMATWLKQACQGLASLTTFTIRELPCKSNLKDKRAIFACQATIIIAAAVGSDKVCKDITDLITTTQYSALTSKENCNLSHVNSPNYSREYDPELASVSILDDSGFYNYDTEEYDVSYSAMPSGDKKIIIASVEGFRDDSVAGSRTAFLWQRKTNGLWQLLASCQQYRCHRGETDDWQKGLCP